MVLRLMIVDDHPALAYGLTGWFARSKVIKIVAIAYCGVDAIELATSLLPDIVLLDSQLPDINGVTVAETIRDSGLPVRILVFSAYEDEQHVRGMLSAGAMGYLLKTESLSTLEAAVQAVSRGEMYFSQRIMEIIQSWGLGSLDALKELSAKELEVLRCMARGKTNPQIATELSITVGTVKNHVTSIYSKLGVQSRVQAVLWALERGLR